LEQEKDLEKDRSLLQRLKALVWNMITTQCGGKFGTMKLATTMQQSLGASKVNFFLFF
jgi:hypothetical protein